MSISDNPLADLLASHPEKEIDERLKPTSSKVSQNSEISCGLGPRCESMNSLTGTMVTKGGEIVDQNFKKVEHQTDPIIVFDGKSESDDSQIGLSVRQPSFVSLHGQLIPKGSDSLDDFVPVIEEVEPLPLDTLEEQDQGEDDDPQIQFIKELKSKNMSRWKAMGYEPPDDLIPLARAASQAALNRRLSYADSMQSALLSASTSNFHVKLSSSNETSLENISEEPAPVQSPPKRRPRSGSFGMKLGEASRSSELMKEILSENPVTIEINAIDEDVEPFAEGEQLLNNEEEDGHFYEEENIDEAPELFGRLNQIVMDPPDSDVVRSLLNGKISINDNTPKLRLKLRQYLNTCSHLLWIAEAEYVTKVMDTYEIAEVPSPQAEIEERINNINSETEKIERDYMKRRQAIEKERDDLYEQEAKEYSEQVAALDQKFNDQEELFKIAKPSNKLLDLKCRAKRALELRHFAEAQRINDEAVLLEEKESKLAMKKIQQKYYDMDAKLKKEFATRHSVSEKKFNYELTKLEEEYKAQLEAQNKAKKVAQLSREHKHTVKKMATSPRSPRLSLTEKESIVRDEASKQSQESSFFATGRLTIRAPKLLDRSSDIQIIQEMASQMSVGKSRNEIDVQSSYSQTTRK